MKYLKKQIYTWISKGICTLLVALSVLLLGCGTERAQLKFNDDHLRTVRSTYMGTVVNVSTVSVKESPSFVGPAVGGVVGGVVGMVIGSAVGSPTGGAIAGATVGAIYGGADDMGAPSHQMTELTVELERGGTMLIIVANDDFFVRGDEVRIISLRENLVRVQHR